MTDNTITTLDEAIYASIKAENHELDALVNDRTKPRALAKRQEDKSDRFGLIVTVLVSIALALLFWISMDRALMSTVLGAPLCLACLLFGAVEAAKLPRKRGEER